jgi:Secretion system C-terminal sorting domain
MRVAQGVLAMTVDFGGGLTAVGQDVAQLPQAIEVRPCYPNPFNPGTTVVYELPLPGAVSLKVYNLLGQVVCTLAEGEYRAGVQRISWNAAGLPSGVYLCRIESGGVSKTTRLLLLK